MHNKFVLDDTLRHLYIAIRDKGARLLAIRFIHRGKKWEADTAEEAVRLRKELEDWDQENAEMGTGEPIDQYIRAESVWTPDTFWNFVHSIGNQQRKTVIALLENKHYWSQHLAKEIGVEEESLGGVLSGLSKQLKQLGLRTSDLYQVHTDWSDNDRKRLFYIQPAFRLAAEEVGWPEERKEEDAPATKGKRKTLRAARSANSERP